MRHILLIATLLSAVATAVGRAADAELEEELTRLSRRIDGAFVKGDTASLADVLADDWVASEPSMKRTGQARASASVNQ